MNTKNKLLILTLGAIIVALIYFIRIARPQKDGNLFVIGTSLDYPPYEFVDTVTGQAAGLDIDVVIQIAARLNKTLVIQNMPFTSLIFSLLTGDIDMIAAGMSPTERRARMVAFTDPYLAAKSLVVLTKKSHFVPQTVSDLQGKTVAVNTGYIADLYMSKQAGVDLVKLDSPSDSFMALQVGSVDAFVCAQVTVEMFLKKTAHPEQFYVIEIPDTQEVCSFAVGKNNEQLLQKINQTVRAMAVDGSMQKIQERWGF